MTTQWVVPWCLRAFEVGIGVTALAVMASVAVDAPLWVQWAETLALVALGVGYALTGTWLLARRRAAIVGGDES